MHSVIANAFDKDLMAIARGKMPWLEAIVHRVMDGEDVEFYGLCGEELDYAKTTKVLLGQIVYSDSWLQ